ncbi:hypothetical protein HRS9122_00993 [Pyrenophora teres f. teres]|nr:hypothetical protein HRS9122_00993 [Pyrenophora teres f. teres]
MATTTEEHGAMQNDSANTTAPIFDEHVDTPDRDTAITELQAALGPLLLTKRNKNEVPYPPVSTGYQSPPPEEPYIYEGVFNLFGLPRELRDEIYRHVLQRPSGVYYARHFSRGFDFWWNRGKVDDLVNLSLVSKRVHEEAFETFCRCNTFILALPYCNERDGLRKPLRGQLRLFPDRAAGELIQVKNLYHDVVDRHLSYWGPAPSHGSAAEGGDGTENHRKDDTSQDTFYKILRDAYVFQEFFPNLLVFHAQWHPRMDGPMDRIAESMGTNTNREECVAMWIKLMREWLENGNVVPLACVRFNLDGTIYRGYDERVDELANEAYQKIVREWKTSEVDIEESGKLWLEEMDKEQLAKKVKKGKKGGRRAHHDRFGSSYAT